MPEKLTNEEIALQYFENSESTDEFVVGEDGGFKSTKWGVWDYVKETGKGVLLGGLKLDEGIRTLRHAAGEKLGMYPEGYTQLTSIEYQKMYEKMREKNLYPETMGGQIVAALFQYATPGIGLYGLMSKIIKIPQGVRFVKKILPIAKRALLAEAGTVTLAQTAEDPNVIGGIAEIFNLDTETAGSFAKDFFNYLATTEDTTEGADASQVLESKWKAIIADSPLGLAAEGVMPFLRIFAKVVRDLRSNPSLVKELEDEVKTAITHGDTAAFKGVEKGIYKEFEGFKTKAASSKSLMGAIKNLKNESGFSLTIDGKAPADLGFNKGYMIAPLKATEIKLNTFTDKDMLKIFENVFALEKTLKGKYGEVYVGAWRNADGNYVFDASVRIDDLNQSLSIAKSGNQDAIFDLSNFDTIEVGKGVKQGAKTGEIEKEFIDIRSKIQTSDLGKKSEGFIPGTKEQLQESGNVKTIMEEMNAAKMDFDKLGIELQDKYNAKWQSRIKDIDRIEEKIATKHISPDKIGDYLGGRLRFKNLNDLKRALKEIKKEYTIIKEENYLTGDAFAKKGKPEQGGYRAVHLQIANKKGQSMELALQLQELLKVETKSYKGYARIRKFVNTLPPERRAAELKKINKLKNEVDTAFLKLKKHPGKDFPFEKFIDAIERKSEITGFIARLNIKGNKTAADIKELKILKSRYHEINQSTAKLASIGGAAALAYVKAVGKRDVNTTRIINAQKEETNGN